MICECKISHFIIMNTKYREKTINDTLLKIKCCDDVQEVVEYFLDGLDILIEFAIKLSAAKSNTNPNGFLDLLEEIINFVKQYKLNNKLIFNTKYQWNLGLNNATTSHSTIELEYNIYNTNNSFQKLDFSNQSTIDNFYKELIAKKCYAESLIKRLYYRKCALQNIASITQCYN